MPDLVLTTARDMPHPAHENDLLLAALAGIGVEALLLPWDDPFDWGTAALVVVRTPWDYWQRREEFLAWADGTAGRTRLVNPAPLLRWNSHKGYLPELAAAGVATIPTLVVPRGAPAAEQAAALAERDGPVVVKPAVSAGARGALLAATPADAVEHLAALTRGDDAIVQPFVPSVATDGEVSLVFFDGTFSHAVRKVPRIGDYRVHAEYGGTVVEHDPTAAEMAVATAALDAAPTPTTYARVDLVRLPDGGPALIELEVTEPELFLLDAPEAATRYARVLAALLR